MNILLVVPGGITEDGSGDVIPVLQSFATSLAAECKVCVLCANHEPAGIREAKTGFRILNPGRHGGAGVGVWRDVTSAMRLLDDSGFAADVVHSFWLGRPGAIARRIAYASGKPWIASIGGQELRADRGQSATLLQRWVTNMQNRAAIRNADAMTAGSKFVLDSLSDRGRSGTWLPLFPDKNRFQPTRSVARDVNDPLRIVTVADHSNAKDPQTLIGAVAVLAQRQKPVLLDWIGREREPGSTAAMAAGHGVSAQLRVRGHLAQDRIAEFLNKSDIYLQSSRYESQGVAVCEAAACGLPLVGTAVGILPEIAPDGALVVAPGKPEALADAIQVLIDDEATRQRLGRGALAWMSDYSIEWTVARAIALYDDTLAAVG